MEIGIKVVRIVILMALVVSFVAVSPGFAQEQAASQVGTMLVAEGLAAPLALESPNDGSGRLFVVDQTGMIWIIGPDGQMMTDPFLNVADQLTPFREDYDERGLLGLAFHPDYANNGRFFVYFTIPLRPEAPADWDHTNVVAEYTVSPDNPNMADPASQQIILQIDQPQFNHDAGHIAFGPDGYLYVPIGDGGGANDVDVGHTEGIGNAQDTSNLHGNILRLDVSQPGTYTIPADNPFVGDDGIADEIFAYGLRNPYHISFDHAGNGALYAADAGQDLYEEVSIITSGGNYGWNIKEGTHCFDPNNPEMPPAECAATGANGQPLIDPIIEYGHDEVGIVVVGGYIYRGTAMPELTGYYIFGDYHSGADAPDGTLLWASPQPAGEGALWTWGELAVAGTESGRLGEYVRGIGEGPDGELYVLTSQSQAPAGDTGKVWKLVPAGEAPMDSGGEAPAEGGTEAPPATAVPAPAQTEEASG